MIRQCRQLSSQRMHFLRIFLPRVVAIAGILLTSTILSSPRSIYAVGIGSPRCRLTIQNANSSLRNLARRYQIAFNAVCPTLVKRFALRPNIVNNFTVTFRPNLASGQGGSAAGNQISINAGYQLANPYAAVGEFIYYLAYAIQNDSPDNTASWFPMSMAFYARSIYGPKDDDWAIPLVQPTDSLSGETGAGFLLWLQQYTVPTLVDQLNRAIQTKQSFSATFRRLTGGTVDQLWNKYKANPNIASFQRFLPPARATLNRTIPCNMTIQNPDPSLEETAQLYQQVFKEVCPLLVKRFAHRPDIASSFMLVFKADMPPGVAAYSDGKALVFDINWLRGKPDNRIGVFIHEFTHHVQNYSYRSWFEEGMATYADSVYSPVGEPPPFPDSVGDSYKDGYGTTARFLRWLEQNTVPNIVDQLNRAIQNGPFFPWTFQRLTGGTVDELWSKYKASPQLKPLNRIPISLG